MPPLHSANTKTYILSNMDIIQSRPFQLTPRAYFRISSGAVLWRWLAWLAVPLLACLVAGCFDLRWWMVGLILLLLVVPFVVFNVYISRLLHPEARRALARQRVTLIPNETLTVTYLPENETESPEQTETIPWTAITGLDLTNGHLILTLKSRKLPLAIPLSSLPPDLSPLLVDDPM